MMPTPIFEEVCDDEDREMRGMEKPEIDHTKLKYSG